MENTGKHLDHDGEVLFSEEGEDVSSEVASEWSTVQLAQKVEEKKHSKRENCIPNPVTQIPQKNCCAYCQNFGNTLQREYVGLLKAYQRVWPLGKTSPTKSFC